jgi:murein L,D-transpeptidase YafK
VSRLLFFIILLLLPGRGAAQEGFLERELQHPRVRQAQQLRERTLQAEFGEKRLSWPPSRMLIRVFKKENQLEVWVADSDSMKLFKTYDVCLMSGGLGPKRRQGDGQVPEGVYQANVYNSNSSFFLSLGLDYPNEADRVYADRAHPGGDIFIHGGCESIGCIAMGRDNIDIMEIFLLAVYARDMSGRDVPVHVFPMRMDNAAWAGLYNVAIESDDLLDFWANLREVYLAFERHRRIPAITVDSTGRYRVDQKSNHGEEE